MMNIACQVGPQVLADGSITQPRLGKTGDIVVQELHGRFFEQTYRGNVYSAGGGLVALSANTIALTASATPILGVWNPATSLVNLVMLQASLQAIINTLTTPVGAGLFVLASSIGNSAISTGSAPLNRKTLQAVGSSAKAFVGNVALTGLSNNLVVQETLGEITSPTGLTYGTIVAPTAGTSLTGFGGVVNFDGGVIVPPGGVLAILNTVSTTTMSAGGRLMWEEVPA